MSRKYKRIETNSIAFRWKRSVQGNLRSKGVLSMAPASLSMLPSTLHCTESLFWNIRGTHSLWGIHYFPRMGSGEAKFGPLQVHLTFWDIVHLSIGQLPRSKLLKIRCVRKSLQISFDWILCLSASRTRWNSASRKHSCFMLLPEPHYCKDDLSNASNKIWPKEQTGLKTTA